MKELSIEEKAKRYDEALKVAKDIRNGEAAYIPDGTPVIEAIFPELKDSEDERIRKELITFFQRYPYERIGNAGTEVKEAIDWLEKQCEQKSVDDLTQQEAMDIAVAKCFNEQKPADTENGAKGNEVEIPISEPPLTIEHAREVMGIKQKPAWSEEDKNRINRLIAYFEDKESFTAEDDIVYANWLKSLKDRVQPKQDWNEDGWTMQDEEELQIALDTLVKAGQHSSAKWLKNVCLSPRNGWKPSEEQLEALRYVTNFDYGGHKATLVSLYKQLKKLKGE